MKKIIHSHTLYLMRDRKFSPVSPAFCGREVCNPGHANEQFLDVYLIHYVESGKGKYFVNNTEYDISGGQCFIIRPYEHHHYIADSEDPWTYTWVAFRGELGEKIDNCGKYVINSDGKYFAEMLRCIEYGDMQEEYLAGKIIEFMCNEFNNLHEAVSYPDMAKNLIDSNYSSHLSVERIADNIGIDRRYLCKLFKKKYNITLKKYIIKKRMTEASLLLKDGFSVNEVSQLVGYDDAFSFSRAFKKEHGYPPCTIKKPIKAGASKTP